MTQLDPCPLLTPATMRVYLALCACVDRGELPTYRRLLAALGLRGPNHIHETLARLRAAGLITSASTPQYRAAGTIRPLYRIEALNV